MQLSTLARLLGFSRDVAIHAAMLLGIVSKDAYVAAVKEGEADLERFKKRAATRELTAHEANRLLCHYALDRVPLPVLRSAWATDSGPRAQCADELLRVLGGSTDDPRIKPDEDGEVPVVAASTAGETSWTLKRKLVIGVVVALGPLAAGLLLDLPLPSFMTEELDSPGDLFGLLAVYVFLNLWLVGWGVHYLSRALGPSTYRGRVRGRVVQAVDQYDYDLDDNELNRTVYPMITVHYVVEGQVYVGVFGDPDNETLRDLAVVMRTSKDWEPGKDVEVRYNPGNPSQFVLGRLLRLRVGLLVVGAGSLVLAAVQNVMFGDAVARWWLG